MIYLVYNSNFTMVKLVIYLVFMGIKKAIYNCGPPSTVWTVWECMDTSIGMGWEVSEKGLISWLQCAASQFRHSLHLTLGSPGAPVSFSCPPINSRQAKAKHLKIISSGKACLLSSLSMIDEKNGQFTSSDQSRSGRSRS